MIDVKTQTPVYFTWWLHTFNWYTARCTVCLIKNLIIIADGTGVNINLQLSPFIVDKTLIFLVHKPE